jgi:two-component system chemotaxis response regulator CheB
MNKHRVLVVDDSAVMRRLLREALGEETSLEVVGAAANGAIALAMIGQLNPDVITLDIEMPEMNGLEALAEIRQKWPKLPVIMFSTLTERGAVTTLEALTRGANDYVTKPAGGGSLAVIGERIREQLVPKIKTLCGAAEARKYASAKSSFPAPPPASPVQCEAGRVDVVVIGTSTGGPNALAEVVPRLPAELPVPILIVQHMPPIFTRFLAERLSARSSIPVKEAINGVQLLANQVWIAPGDYHLGVIREGARVYLTTHQGAPENSCRPSVDVLFRSAASVFGSNTLAVVMTGMGQDGLAGAQEIRAAGGQVLVQDQDTSVVWSMPGSVAHAGLAHAVLPLAQIGPELVRRIRQKRNPRLAKTVGAGS